MLLCIEREININQYTTTVTKVEVNNNGTIKNGATLREVVTELDSSTGVSTTTAQYYKYDANGNSYVDISKPRTITINHKSPAAPEYTAIIQITSKTVNDTTTYTSTLTLKDSSGRITDMLTSIGSSNKSNTE